VASVHQCANGQRACPEQSRRVATRVDGSLYYVHQDHLGSTVAVSDAAGQPLSRSHYLPYGGVYKSEYWDGNQWQEYDPANTPIPETDYLHTGHLLDRNTNLYYYGGGRYYDPALAHFTTPSQYSDAPFNPQALNRYGFRLGNPLRYAQVGERYLFDRGAGTAVADVLPPDTFTAGFGRVVSAQPSTLTGVDLQDMVTSVPLGLGVRIAKTVRLARKLPTAYAMWRGGFNVVRAGYYVPGSPKWLVYGTHAIRHGLDIPPTLSHAGTSGLTSYRHLATYARGPLEASLAALRASWLWIIGPAILVNAYEYSPWGPKGDIGYGTECAAAVTVDIVLAGASVGAGAFTMAFLITVLHVSAGPAAFVGLVVSGYILWRGAEFKEPLVKQVSGFYEAMIEELEDRW
jgi:RHS repeat-associated protein